MCNTVDECMYNISTEIYRFIILNSRNTDLKTKSIYAIKNRNFIYIQNHKLKKCFFFNFNLHLDFDNNNKLDEITIIC